MGIDRRQVVQRPFGSVVPRQTPTPHATPRVIKQRPHNRKQAETLHVGDTVTVGDELGDWEGVITAIDPLARTYTIREIL